MAKVTQTQRQDDQKYKSCKYYIRAEECGKSNLLPINFQDAKYVCLCRKENNDASSYIPKPSANRLFQIYMVLFCEALVFGMAVKIGEGLIGNERK